MIFDWMNYITILALSIVCVGLGVAMDDWMKPGKIFSFLRFWIFWVTKGDMLFHPPILIPDIQTGTLNITRPKKTRPFQGLLEYNKNHSTEYNIQHLSKATLDIK